MEDKVLGLLAKYRANVFQLFKDDLCPSISNDESLPINDSTNPQIGQQIIVADERLIHNIEKSIYNATVERATLKHLTIAQFPLFIELYKARAFAVKSNLDRIIPLLQSKQCKFSQVGYIKMTDVAPDLWATIQVKLDKQYQSQFNTIIEASSELYTCFKCRNNKTVVFEAQTRSADEPMTQFITCITCGNKWRR